MWVWLEIEHAHEVTLWFFGTLIGLIVLATLLEIYIVIRKPR